MPEMTDILKLVWLGALILFIVGEAATVGLTAIWFAVGALAALCAALLGGAVWFQIGIFLLTSLFALLLIRPLARKYLKPHYQPTNADRIIGQEAVVVQNIDNLKGEGQIRVEGAIWTARSGDDTVIPEGSRVHILRIEGVKVLVEERKESLV